METEGRIKVKSDVILHRFVVVASLLCFVINASILCISCVSGQWVFGMLFCQLYGMVSQVLVAGGAWMVALAAVERAYKLLLPTEHVATFSEINIRILTYGLYLLLLIMFTAPLYGWGEYSNFRGAVHLHMDVFPGNDTSCFDNIPYGIVIKNATESTILTLHSVYECEARFFLPARALVLRFPTRQHLQSFHHEYTSGMFKEHVYDTLVTSLKQCNETRTNIEINFKFSEEKLNKYTDVHLAFQELGICSLDFSPVNANISSWIPFSVITTSVLPFGVAFVVGLILYRTHGESGARVHRFSPCALIIGSLLGLGSTFPYYVSNIYNNKELHVDHTLNVVSTVLYYSGALWYVIASALIGCVKRRKRRHDRCKIKRKGSAVSLNVMASHQTIESKSRSTDVSLDQCHNDNS